MSRHNFESVVAEQVGVNAAVIYQNLKFWCEKNAANEKHLHDGKVWTYNSIRAFERLFPYLSKSQIRTALDKLESSEFVEVGNYNSDPRDRTKWYAISGDMHLGNLTIAVGSDHQPLPDSKPTDIKQTPKPPVGAGDLFKAETETDQQNETLDVSFERFWEVYPKKAGKPAALKAWGKAVQKEQPDKIIAAAERYAAWLSNAKPGEFRPLPKYPQGWLNDGRWDEFSGVSGSEQVADLTASQRSMLEGGRVPPSMLDGDKANAAARFWLKKFGHGGVE